MFAINVPASLKHFNRIINNLLRITKRITTNLWVTDDFFRLKTLEFIINWCTGKPTKQGSFHIRSVLGDLMSQTAVTFNPLKPELNPICYLLALLGAHHFLHVSRIRVKLLTLGYQCHKYMEHPFLMFLDHTQRRSTVGRTHLDE